MIPILYESGTTTFTTNGIGRLTDCISCRVTEERNGIFEAEFEYPITGQYYSEIQEGRIITVTHDEQKDKQPFIIYARSAEISGKVTFYAHHISYLLNGIIVQPFTATSVADAFNTFSVSSINTNPFIFWTDNATGGSMNIEVPSPIRSVMGGSKGSILDAFGGEYKFDNYLVRNYASRGANNGVTIRYGKNLTKLNQKTDAEFLYNAVVAYWSDNEETVVYTGVVAGTGQTAALVSTLDLSSEFDEQPTVEQLTTKAQQFLDNNQPWIPKENIKIDFVALWQTEEYKDVAPLERVQLCDTVTVYYPELGVEATAKVIKVVWDALSERYSSIELGDARSSFADTVVKEATDGVDELLSGFPTTSAVQSAINHATELITGGLGGHIVFLYDANGKPTDMLVMDTDDVSTAVHVLRINVNGIGFSSTGVSGNYSSAWLLDGTFIADWITSGHMSCNRIQGGTLTLGGTDNGNGVIVVYDASGTEIGRWDKDGLSASGSLEIIGESQRLKSSIALKEKKALIDVNYGASSPALWYIDAFGEYLKSTVKSTGVTESVWFRAPYMPSSTGIQKGIHDTSWAAGDRALVHFYTTQNPDDSASVPTAYQEFSLTTEQGSTPGVFGKIVDKINNTHTVVLHTDKEMFHYGTSTSNASSSISTTYRGEAQLKVDTTGIRFQGGTSSAVSSIGVINSTINFTAGANATVSGNSISITAGTTSATTNYPRITANASGASSGAFYNYVTGTIYTGYNGSNWVLKDTTRSGTIQITGSSSKRYKHDITADISEELDAHRLYDLEMKQFVFNADHPLQYGDMKGKTLPGFIAEEVAEIYPSAAIHDNDGNVESWDERRIIPGMLKLIQEQKEQLDKQQQLIDDLTKRLEKLEAMIGG